MGSINTAWKAWHNLAWALFLAGMPFSVWYLSKSPIAGKPVVMWWLFMTGLVLILFITGHGITGSWKGALVDNRNVISLSRFQMMAWTTLILSAFGAAVFWNVFHEFTPNSISCLADTKKGCLPGLDLTLWLLMGISTASLVGSPLILNAKKNQRPDSEELHRTFELLSQQGYDETQLDNEGQLVVNADPKQARWSDLFTGEETGNFAHLDLARMQMFFFTLISLLSYGVVIGHQLGSATAPITDFPVLNEGLLALIGISHTGYLAAKASQNSQTGSAATRATPPANSTADDEHPAVG